MVTGRLTKARKPRPIMIKPWGSGFQTLTYVMIATSTAGNAKALKSRCAFGPTLNIRRPKNAAAVITTATVRAANRKGMALAFIILALYLKTGMSAIGVVGGHSAFGGVFAIAVGPFVGSPIKASNVRI